MKFKSNILVTVLSSFLLFSGCSKDVEEYNKPAAYWYSKVISSIASGDIEKADNYYSSLQGEHIGSPLLPEATLILAIAHMHYEEYLLSEHFSNEYMKRYANANEREFTEFLKIKAKYMALPNPRRDQVLIIDAIKESEEFKLSYPNSIYYPVVDTILTNLQMAEAALNETIADLYVRLDKPRSAEYYRDKKAQPWMKWDEIDRANSPWYREWFEGDGTQSWYAFMIPDTQSVVSRNTAYENGLEIEQSSSETKEVIEVEAAAQEEVEDKVVQEAVSNGGSETQSDATQPVEEQSVQQETKAEEPLKETEEAELPWYKPWFGTDAKEKAPEEEKPEENEGNWYNFNSWF